MKEPVPLPQWAQEIVPVDMDGAAMLLGISRRFLVNVIRLHPHYEPRGNRKVFYPEHIALLREALRREAVFRGSATDDAYRRAMSLATAPKGSRVNSRSNSSNAAWERAKELLRKPSRKKP